MNLGVLCSQNLPESGQNLSKLLLIHLSFLPALLQSIPQLLERGPVRSIGVAEGQATSSLLVPQILEVIRLQTRRDTLSMGQ